MGEFIVEKIDWKKGESGIQNIIIYESDGVTRRDGTGKIYNFAFWKLGSTAVKGSGALVADNAVQGEWHYVLGANDTDTVEDYKGEIIEDPSGSKLRSDTFDVNVLDSSDRT